MTDNASDNQSETCEMPLTNAGDEEIDRLIAGAKNIAVVGLSTKPERDSFKVAKYLRDRGYNIIPVNPMADEILGVKSYPTLKDIPAETHIDIVDIFRKIDAIPAIVEESIEIGAGAVWMQLGLAHNESAEKARAAGLQVVMSKCLKIEHARQMM